MGWAAVAYAIATLLLAYPVLSGQFLVNPRSDQYIAGFAFRDFAAQALRAGQGIPQWNPYMFGGLPYVAAMTQSRGDEGNAVGEQPRPALCARARHGGFFQHP